MSTAYCINPTVYIPCTPEADLLAAHSVQKSGVTFQTSNGQLELTNGEVDFYASGYGVGYVNGSEGGTLVNRTQGAAVLVTAVIGVGMLVYGLRAKDRANERINSAHERARASADALEGL